MVVNRIPNVVTVTFIKDSRGGSYIGQLQLVSVDAVCLKYAK